jgi:hypothetical protein
MANKFIGFLETVGKLFQKGLTWAVAEAPAADALLNIIYPGSAVITGPATAAINLLQNSIITIEQKYAASGVQSGTGAQKAAEVLSLAGPAATSLLTTAGVSGVDDTYINNLITALVAVLNVKIPATAPATGVSTPPAAVTA